MLSEQLKNSTLKNLWDTHPPFQIDGNFGATSGVAEMLLQSQSSVISVLPALPASWPAGRIDGLTARGDVTVGATWKSGQAREIRLTAGQTGERTVRSPLFAGRFTIRDSNGHTVEATKVGADTVRLRLTAGQTYTARTHVAVELTAPASAGWSPTFPAEVAVRAEGKTMPSATVRLQVPAGWKVTPAEVRLGPLRPGADASAMFTVTVPATADPGNTLRATVSGDGWSAGSPTRVATVDPAVIPGSQISVHDVDSEETAAENGRATNVLDGKHGDVLAHRVVPVQPAASAPDHAGPGQDRDPGLVHTPVTP